MMNNQLLFTACIDCGQRVTGDSIHTCSPQLKELTDEEIWKLWVKHLNDDIIVFARAILRKAQEK
jgi:hypothetical protein